MLSAASLDSMASSRTFTLPSVSIPLSPSRPCFFSPRPLKQNCRFAAYSPSAASAHDFSTASQSTFYDLLGVSRDVSSTDIKHAYRQMALKYHPDVCPPSLSEESSRRFIEIQEAYETLSDPRSRELYDRAISTGVSTTGRSCIFRASDAEFKTWKSQWMDQLDGLKIRNTMRANRAESWASKMRKQRESGYHSE